MSVLLSQRPLCTLDEGPSFETVRERILQPLQAARGSDRYQPLSGTDQADFARLATGLIHRDRCVADLATLVGYEVVSVRDETNDREVAVLWESGPSRHQGALIVALDPDARPIVLEAPHVQHDAGTGAEALALFVGLRARAAVISTAHRCTSSLESACDGEAPVCGPKAPYRSSDAAHAIDGAFHSWHRALMQADPSLVAVQLHGFARTPDKPLHAYVSDGTPLPADETWLTNRIAKGLGEDLPGGAASCNRAADKETARHCATVNVQGRDTNGSASPCDTPPTTSTGRFVHLEQSIDLRRKKRDLVLAVLDAQLPR